MSSIKIKQKDLAIIFLILFPVIPSYFQVSSISVSNILCIVLSGSGLLLGIRGTKHIKFSMLYCVIYIWIFARWIAYMQYGAYMEGIWFLVRTLIAGIFIISVLKSKEIFIKAINCIVYTGGVIGFFGIIESVTHFNIFQLLNTSGVVLNYNPLRFGMLRIISFHSQTIVYCVYLMFIASLTFYSITLKENINKKTRYRIIYILLLINAIMTMSRSAILALIISQLLLLLRCGYIKLIKRVGFGIVILAIMYTFVQFIIPSIASMGKNLLYMILAVFDDRYETMISAAFGNDNLSATGNRTDLYSWVWDCLRGHEVFGRGAFAKFSYNYTASNGLYSWSATKKSIEVQYLAILYNYGIVGLIIEVTLYLGLLINCIVKKFKPAYWESKLSFNYICFIMFVAYFFEFFVVNQSSEYRMFYVLVFLLIAYNQNHKFQIQEQLREELTYENCFIGV